MHEPIRLSAGVMQRHCLSCLQTTSSKFSPLAGDIEIIMPREWISCCLGYYSEPLMLKSILNFHNTGDDGCDVGGSGTFFLVYHKYKDRGNYVLGARGRTPM